MIVHLSRALAAGGLLLLALAAARPARAQEPQRTPERTPEVSHDVVLGGDHFRIRTPHGPVHVWRPAGYDPRGAGIVVYVHGYQDSVDEAWRDHHLARQFKRSRQNAVFIVPDAPASADDAVAWPKLSELLKTVRAKTRAPLPDGELVVFGHSGAFRTIASWLDNHRLDYVILLDGLYGEQDRFHTWLETAKGHQSHTLIVIASETLDRAEDFVVGFKGVVRRDGLPEDYAGFTRAQRQARILLVRSQYGHMELVTSGNVIPVVLRLTPLRRLRQQESG
jgi:hypothetical protein